MATFQKSEQSIQKQKKNPIRFEKTHSTWNQFFLFVFTSKACSLFCLLHPHELCWNTEHLTCTEWTASHKIYTWTSNYRENVFVFFKLITPIYCREKCICKFQSTLVPVLIQLPKAHSYWLQVTDEGIEAMKETTIRQLYNTMASVIVFLNKKRQSIQAGKTCIWPTLLQSQNFFKFHCVAVFTLSLELLNGLRSAVGLTQRIPPFGDKLRQGLILWPKLAASSNTVSEKWRQQHFNSRFALHLRADSHHREIKKIKIDHGCFWPDCF